VLDSSDVPRDRPRAHFAGRIEQKSEGTGIVTIADRRRLCDAGASPYGDDVAIESVGQRATGRVRRALSRTRSGSPDRKEAISGSFDGMTSTLGVVAGLLAAHATPSKILAAAIGIGWGRVGRLSGAVITDRLAARRWSRYTAQRHRRARAGGHPPYLGGGRQITPGDPA